MSTFAFLTVLLSALLQQISTFSSENRCEKINIEMCQNIGYNITVMPNFFGHENQLDAGNALEDFKDIIDHSCSQFLRLFVCSVYVPMCSEHVSTAIQPCRGLCEQVKTDCLPELQKLKLKWPEKLNCSNFPEQQELCILQPRDDEAIVHEAVPSIEDHIRNLKPRNNCPSYMVFTNNMCLKLCNSDSKYSAQERFLYEVWTAVWSFSCIFVTGFALLTFMIEPKRFRWPARPILFLTICGFITSLVYLLRWIFGPYTCSGEASILKPYDNWLCISIALVLTFCEFAFCMWWCVFCLVWYLSAAKEWSTEAIERTAPRLHAVTWTASIVPIIYALVSNNIIINEFSGFCEVTSFLLTVFQTVFVLLGAVMAVLTSVALKRVRKTLIYAGKSPFKLERLIYRLGVISLGICLPLLVCLMCFFLDTLTVALLKVCLRLLSAIFASFWVFSSKTFKSWNKILRPSFTHKGMQNVPVTKV